MKIKKQPLAVQLVEAEEKEPSRKPLELVSSQFSRRLIHHPDREAASALIVEQANFEAEQKYGAELTKLKLDIEDIDTTYKYSWETLYSLQEKKKLTSQYIKSGTLMSSSDKKVIHWSDWLLKDRILLCLIIAFLILSCAMGMANVYANLVASNPVFIESPWLAVMISSLLPIASVSIKFVTNFMAFDRSRKRYTLFIYIATGVAFFCWAILFGLNNTGVASTVNWNSFDDSTDLGSAFVWAQLMVEVLAASALFLAAEDIYMRYSPDVYLENPEYIEIEKALKDHLVLHEALREQRGNMHGRLVELTNEKSAFVNDKIVEYISLRASHVARLNSHIDS